MTPLTPEETAATRAMLADWPRVKAIADRYEAARKGVVDWITGILARNPKLSNAITSAVSIAIAAVGVWFAKPVPPPEVVHVPVPVPVEVRPAEPQRPAPQPSLEQPKTPPPRTRAATGQP